MKISLFDCPGYVWPEKLIEAGGAMQKLALNSIWSWKRSDNYLEKYPSRTMSTIYIYIEWLELHSSLIHLFYVYNSVKVQVVPLYISCLIYVSSIFKDGYSEQICLLGLIVSDLVVSRLLGWIQSLVPILDLVNLSLHHQKLCLLFYFLLPCLFLSFPNSCRHHIWPYVL